MHSIQRSGRQALGALRVLEADLGHHVELGRQLPHVAGLLNVRKGDGPVRDLHVTAAEALAQVAEVVEAVLEHELLEEGASEVVVDAGVVQHVDLALEVGGDDRRPPPNFTKSRNSAPLSTTSWN